VKDKVESLEFFWIINSKRLMTAHKTNRRCEMIKFYADLFEKLAAGAWLIGIFQKNIEGVVAGLILGYILHRLRQKQLAGGGK
jgi:hypothetical protein